MGEKMRIYIGGLGSSVQDDDLRKTFSSPQLGTVESVEIIRTKDRSFGYLEFVPVSEKGLAKLFSTYNGCLWKGGKLRLEKAKEHYLFRLRREWTEDAEPEINLSNQNVDADHSVPVLQKPRKDLDIDKTQLNLFFPKLRRIKPIPFKGTGKHKYSFQRVEIPPLPIHFCDCEEHSVPPELAKRNSTVAYETDVFGVNDGELNMMKSILNKLLDRNSSKTVRHVSNQAVVTEETNYDAADDVQVDDNEEDEVSDEVELSDEDNLVINIVGNARKRVTSFEDWGQKITAVNQEPLVREPVSFSRPIPEMHGNEKKKLLPNKKRKQSIEENNVDNIATSNKKGKKEIPQDSTDVPVAVKTPSLDTKSGHRNEGSSHKSAWKELVRDKSSTAFHISDVLMDCNPETESEPRSNCVLENDDKEDESSKVKEDVQSTKPSACLDENDDKGNESSEVEEDPRSTKPNACVDENDDKGDESSKVEEDLQSSKPSAANEKLARGAAWLQKSSWLQLIGDTSSSKFNLAQVLPGVTFQNQETPQIEGNAFSSSRNGGFLHKDRNSPVEDMGKPDTPDKGRVGVLAMEQLNSDLKQAVEENEESAPLNATTNVVQTYKGLGDSVVSETCPFMRTRASMKEWKKLKAALSGSRRKKGKGKEEARD